MAAEAPTRRARARRRIEAKIEFRTDNVHALSLGGH